MKTMKIFSIVLIMMLLLIPGLNARDRAVVQVALLLDTSNSMDGLISQAKSNLWKIVNRFSSCRKYGRTAHLKVALYEYGNNWLSSRDGYIRQVLPFTEDLDRISEELFRLRTYGGAEYCGMVIEESLARLDWSRRPGDLKAIYIAGNEPFDQGPVNYRNACLWASDKNIRVNTIFCGDYHSGVRGYWQDGARIGRGRYMNINQDYRRRQYDTPYDTRILELNNRLNDTYIPYGIDGINYKRRQSAQDANAMGLSSAIMTERAAVKASSQYTNSGWDIIDAVTTGAISLSALSASALPLEIAHLSSTEQRAYIQKMSDERKAIQQEIAALTQKRNQYIQQLSSSDSGESSLDQAIISSVVDMAREEGFVFE